MGYKTVGTSISETMEPYTYHWIHLKNGSRRAMPHTYSPNRFGTVSLGFRRAWSTRNYLLEIEVCSIGYLWVVWLHIPWLLRCIQIIFHLTSILMMALVCHGCSMVQLRNKRDTILLPIDELYKNTYRTILLRTQQQHTDATTTPPAGLQHPPPRWCFTGWKNWPSHLALFDWLALFATDAYSVWKWCL